MERKWREILAKNELLLGNKDTYKEGIKNLISVRNEILLDLKSELADFEYTKIPSNDKLRFKNKSIAYCIYETYRLEDILVNTLIKDEVQIFFKDDFNKKLNITTPVQELSYNEIKEFSLNINIDELWRYAQKTNESANEYLNKIVFKDIVRHFDQNDVDKIDKTSMNYLFDSLRVTRWAIETLYGFLIRDLSYTLVLNFETCMNIKDEFNQHKAI